MIVSKTRTRFVSKRRTEVQHRQLCVCTDSLETPWALSVTGRWNTAVCTQPLNCGNVSVYVRSDEVEVKYGSQLQGVCRLHSRSVRESVLVQASLLPVMLHRGMWRGDDVNWRRRRRWGGDFGSPWVPLVLEWTAVVLKPEQELVTDFIWIRWSQGQVIRSLPLSAAIESQKRGQLQYHQGAHRRYGSRLHFMATNLTPTLLFSLSNTIICSESQKEIV